MTGLKVHRAAAFSRTAVLGIVMASIGAVSGCKSTEQVAAGERGEALSTKESWGELNGKDVHLFTLRNENGLTVKATDYGATLTQVWTPDREGRFADITLGFNTFKEYRQTGVPYFGAIVGRSANRIDSGRFTLDGTDYQLATNDGAHHLHGGDVGFDKRVWKGEILKNVENGEAVRFTRVSPAGEENYPGTLTASVTYTLTNDDELITDIEAITDEATLCNIAQHAYWNLAGQNSGTVKDQVLTLYASRYTPVGPTLIPTGELAPVENTAFDFTQGKPIGQDLEAAGGNPIGFDHNFVVDGPTGQVRPVAKAVDPKSGRVMELSSDQPGVQFYSGNFLDSTLKGKEGATYDQYEGFCLETQLFPNAINEPGWPQPVLRPGQVYHHRMVTKFSAE